MFLNHHYRQVIFNQIASSPVNSRQGYVYSDLHYYLYPDMIRQITGQYFDQYLYKTYQNIGANTLTFNPLDKISIEKIVPTEYDSIFRQNLLHGYVHDEGAAMLGGISGHAGLFGNANDLTKLMQMYLQKAVTVVYSLFVLKSLIYVRAINFRKKKTEEVLVLIKRF